MKKEKYSLMDDLNKLLGGGGPESSLNDSVEMAYSQLLGEVVSKEKVMKIAQGLHDGPMTYENHDLAFAVALNFYKNKDYIGLLQGQQLLTRAILLESLQSKKLNPMLAGVFEDYLYNLYKK